MVCKTCLKSFEKPYEISVARYKKRIYCSVLCRANDKDRKKVFTEMMSKPFSPERKARHKLAFKRGKESHRWIEDRTKLKVDEKKHLDTKYKYWMLSVKKRDNWKCKINNSDCSGRLESHHILSWKDFPELRYEINNGITLCISHHPRSRAKEKELSPYFKDLISKE